MQAWHEAARTTLGLFWTAFWAFGLGYLISSLIQVFVTRERMRRSMGEAGPKSVALGTVFGFASSSCSFAALATTRALFAKGAGLVPSLAFLLASTNLVVELGIVIAVFLGWQFVVGEYVGGVLLILLMWLVVRLTRPAKLIEQARKRAQRQEGDASGEVPDWKALVASAEGWRRVANRYVMEWRMVWKDVTIGFTVAGVIATFVPRAFFETLFLGAAHGDAAPSPPEVLVQSIVGPAAAFFTFIGSMGNIPLAAVLLGNGVSFAGVLAFLFSDLIVFPVVRIQAQYYGWKLALYIAGVFLVILVAAAVLIHYAFAWLGLLPDQDVVRSVVERDYFSFDYTFYLDIVFLALSVGFLAWKSRSGGVAGGGDSSLGQRVLLGFALLALAWLAGGLLAPALSGA